MMKIMKKFQEDPYIQRAGVRYFQDIGHVEVIKERVKQAKILPVLGIAAEAFRNKEEEDYELAFDVLKMYI